MVHGSECDAGFIHVCRAHHTELVKCDGEQLEELLEPVKVFDHASDLYPEFVNTIGKIGSEPAFIVDNFKPHFRLRLQEVSDLLIAEKLAQTRLVISLDDKVAIEVGKTDIDILHAEEFSQVCEDAGSMDQESETVRIDVWRA